jgi:hypothetical protein
MKNSQIFELAQEHKRESFEFKYAGGHLPQPTRRRVMALEQDMKINRMFIDVAIWLTNRTTAQVDNEVDMQR